MYGVQHAPMYPMQAMPVHGMQAPPMPGIQQPLLYGMQGPPNMVPGYEGIGGGFLPPPPIQPLPTPDSQPVQDWSIPALSEEDAREAFHNYANSNCCYSSGPATEGVITNLNQFNTYRYRLETYTESRKTEWATKPYDGQPLPAQTPMVPNPWEVPVKAPAMFTNTIQEVEVPNTSSVKQCDTCSASGKVQCSKCNGSKTRQCTTCSGSGKVGEGQVCENCSGTGKMKCPDCSGHGKTECGTCKGKKQLLSYIKLSVEWKNNAEDYIAQQSSGLDEKELSSITGKKLYKDTKFVVYPLNGFPERSVAESSERMIREHHTNYSKASRILQQQHSVELIPITKVTYRWHEKDYVYFVFGVESKVKAVDYPGACCCTIL